MAGNQATPQTKRGSKPTWMQGVGPYIGRVVNHLDTEYMGSIEVEILHIAQHSGVVENSGFLIPCTYVSPFAGQTPFYGATDNEGFDNTQKSYGFWAVPPDVGVRVLVLMAENNFSYGFWIGCIQDKFMNFMMPGNASTQFSKEGGKYNGKPVPVGEYNKTREKGYANDPTKYLKPVDTRQSDILEKQGLLNVGDMKIDEHRGLVSSSARRDIPSMVFGMSTPGPADQAGPKVKYHTEDHQTQVPFSRLGGTSWVMDDGDSLLQRKKTPDDNGPEYAQVELGEEGDKTIPHNELFRVRTRTGHQILMHNSEDFIYIINSQGTAWIELTNNGKIDIYSKDSVSIHTENDINVKAERDINFEALRNINIKAHEQMRIESGHATHWKVGTLKEGGDHLYADVSRDVNWRVGTHPDKGDFKLEISKDFLITVDKDFKLKVKENIHQKSIKETRHYALKSFHQKTDMSFHMQSKAATHIKSTQSDVKIRASVNSHMHSGSNNYMTAGSSNHIKGSSANHMSASTNNFLASTNRMHALQYFGTGAAPALPGVVAAGAIPAVEPPLPECAHHAWIPIRIPMHEPYESHENLDPKEFKPDKTDSTKSIADACEFSKQYEQAKIPYVISADTFAKGGSVTVAGSANPQLAAGASSIDT